MAQPLMLPGKTIVPITDEVLNNIKRVVDQLKNPLCRTPAMIGQIEDRQAGLKPLPKKPDPVREIPGFPLDTYNFLKRLS
jgi:hypothetical protein